MKFSHRLLKELSGTKKSAKELERLLMFHAFEVEEVVKNDHGLDDVYIGLVEAKEKHPNADRLNVLAVNVGRQGVYQIVCGAPNVAVGQKVAVVLPGATLPGDFAITEREIRGVKSFGMVCSEKELGLGEGHEGILVLPEEAPIGALFAKYFGIDDSILDIKILPDRAGDALSYHGVAREIAALDGYAPEFAEIEKKQLRIPSYNRAPKVTVTDKQGCNRYLGLYFEGVENGESPLWLKVRLLLSGLRPKNVVVDITNYLMLLTGQPVHAFDADKLKKGVVIRKAKKGEKIKLLTGNTIKLDTADIVIADASGPIALAGIMGGASTAVTSKSKNIFLEIATFDALSIRKSRQRHKLSTDASYRYERGLDSNLPKEVAVEAALLFATLTEGRLLGMRDEKISVTKARKIKLPVERVNEVLGTKVPLFEIVQSLALLGLGVKTLPGRKMLEVTIPSRRKDLVDEWNLVEEVARMHGYDKVTPEAPRISLAPGVMPPLVALEDSLKDIFVAQGMAETLSYSFLSPAQEGALKSRYKMYSLVNPLNPEESVLRPTLLPGILTAALANLRWEKEGALFEVGSIFQKGKTGPIEESALAFVATTKRQDVFFAAKETLENIFNTIKLPPRRYEALSSPLYEEGQAASVYVGNILIAEVGRLYSESTQKGEVSFMGAEIFLERLLPFMSDQKREFIVLPKFPFATRDISLGFPQSVTAGQVETVFEQFGKPLLQSYTLFDIFEKGEEKRLGYKLVFGHPERTITSEEMEEAFQQIVKKMGEELLGKL